MFSEVALKFVDVLGTWTESWKPGQFKCTRFVFKDSTVYIGLHLDYVKFMLPHFLEGFHEHDYIMEGHRDGYVLSFSCRKCDL